MSRTAPRRFIPFVHVQDVRRSIAFYETLGFRVGNTHQPPGHSAPVWAWLESGEARVMVALASGPVDAGQQAVLFYLYVDDIPAAHAAIAAAGFSPGPIGHPFYCPHGEFRLMDPDGYVIMVAHT